MEDVEISPLLMWVLAEGVFSGDLRYWWGSDVFTISSLGVDGQCMNDPGLFLFNFLSIYLLKSLIMILE